MAFIYEQSGWPAFRWDEAVLTPLLSDVRHSQGRLLGRMESVGFSLRDEAELVTLTSEVVRSSAIEGEVLDPEEVRSSLARRLGIEIGGTAPVSRHVDGVVEMMLDATRKYDEPLTEERLFGWHTALFPGGRSGLRKITVGSWRTAESGPMQVVSGAIGRERVHFEAPAAERIEEEMNTFLEWFNALPETDAVMKAGVAHFWFVTVHPFEDGNGRIARAVADMALARADGTPDRFYSMSTQIETERDAYYSILERSQRGGLEITAWLRWFLECLGRAVEGSDTMLEGVLRKARAWDLVNRNPVSDRQRKVLNRLVEGFEGNLTVSKYAKIADCSTDTALRDIRELIDRGILVKNPAGGRSTSYRISEEFGE